MKYGLLKDKYNERDYVFGGGKLPREPLQPNGQWDEFLPEYEPQSNDLYDTYGCTIFATINCLETLYARLYGIAPNYSERYHYNAIPVRPPGGTPNQICESIRKRGVVDQAKLPFTETFDEYQTPTPITAEYLELGKEWLSKHTFGHEFVWEREPSKEDKIVLMKAALMHSPLMVSVTAWHEGPDGSYVDLGQSNNHLVECFGYIEKNGETYFKIFDSYDHTLKTLHPNHNIEVAKRIYLDDRYYVDNHIDKKSNWIVQGIKSFVSFIKDIIRK